MAANAIPKSSLSALLRGLQLIILLAAIMYFGRVLFVPLMFGLLVAVIIYPSCKWLEKKNWPRSIAVAVMLLLIISIFSLLAWLLVYEIRTFLKEVPQIKEKLVLLAGEISDFIGRTFELKDETRSELINDLGNGISKSFAGSIGSAVSITGATVYMLVMIPVYAALFVMHRGTFVKFLLSAFNPGVSESMNSILQNSITAYHKFVKGTFFVYCVVGALNSIGLLLLGIPHAIMFGVVTAFMTIIPYLGIIVSAALPVSVALLTKDSLWYPIGVVLVFTIVQYLEANIIFPKIVGSQLNLSTWSVLLVIILGSIIWGVSGMILFVPLLSIVKLISDQAEELKPINILISRQET